ncbi:hypothetical protein ATCC90586_009441 [Pythium insidiosum]|nr:hypothetical protein ATCC90586_009441 [Pythium insidiosum]
MGRSVWLWFCNLLCCWMAGLVLQGPVEAIVINKPQQFRKFLTQNGAIRNPVTTAKVTKQFTRENFMVNRVKMTQLPLSAEAQAQKMIDAWFVKTNRGTYEPPLDTGESYLGNIGINGAVSSWTVRDKNGNPYLLGWNRLFSIADDEIQQFCDELVMFVMDVISINGRFSDYGLTNNDLGMCLWCLDLYDGTTTLSTREGGAQDYRNGYIHRSVMALPKQPAANEAAEQDARRDSTKHVDGNGTSHILKHASPSGSDVSSSGEDGNANEPVHPMDLTTVSNAPRVAIEIPPPTDDTTSPRLGRKKLSVANLIRSFSPRSRTARAKTDAASTAAMADNSKGKQPPPVAVRTTFGKLKRSSLGSPKSPDTTPSEQPPSEPVARSLSPSLKWKQITERVSRDGQRLKEQAAPEPKPPAPPEAPIEPTDSRSDPDSGTDFVRDVRTNLEKLVTQLDAVDPRKLAAIRLGGELRGLLGKAQDEFLAYESAFLDHASKVGVLIALQNFAASLHQVYPIIDRLQTAKFLLNRTFKRDVLFAFQEINSYYTSLFMELSMAVAQQAGVTLPLPSAVTPSPVAVEEPAEPTKPAAVVPETPPPPAEPSADQLCLDAHQWFFGHGCAVDELKARDLYQRAADRGHVIAMRCLGHMYMTGKGGDRDLFVAEKWLQQAIAAGGDLEASHLLGCLLCERAATNSPESEAQKLLRLATLRLQHAAENGHREAQYRLGRLLERTARAGDDEQVRRASQWYRRAAAQHHVQATSAQGRLLYQGVDTFSGTQPPASDRGDDIVEAIHFLQRAAAHDDADACYLLGEINSRGDGVKRDVDRAIAYLRRAVNGGHHVAMYRLATILLETQSDGQCGNNNRSSKSQIRLADREALHDEALQLLLTAAQSGDIVDANAAIGDLLETSSLLRDRSAALRFFLKAANAPHKPHGRAAKRAADMLYSGIGCSVNKAEAHRLYCIAGDCGEAEALNALGLMHEEGDGCELDFTAAATCFRRGAELQNAHAHFNLGILLAHGKGVARNLEAAQAHFERAVALGYDLARDFLRAPSDRDRPDR